MRRTTSITHTLVLTIQLQRLYPMLTSNMNSRELDKKMNSALENSGFRGFESTVKGCNVTREYKLFNVASERRKQRRKRLALDTQQKPAQTSETKKIGLEFEIRILKTQNNEISNSCRKGLLATEEQINTIGKLVIANKHEHMTLPEIQIHLDNQSLFSLGHVLTAYYFRSIAKRIFKM